MIASEARLSRLACSRLRSSARRCSVRSMRQHEHRVAPGKRNLVPGALDMEHRAILAPVPPRRARAVARVVAAIRRARSPPARRSGPSSCRGIPRASSRTSSPRPHSPRGRPARSHPRPTSAAGAGERAVESSPRAPAAGSGIRRVESMRDVRIEGRREAACIFELEMRKWHAKRHGFSPSEPAPARVGEICLGHAPHPLLLSLTPCIPTFKRPSTPASSPPPPARPSNNSSPAPTSCTKAGASDRSMRVNFLVSQMTIHFKTKKGHTDAAPVRRRVAPGHRRPTTSSRRRPPTSPAVKARAKDDPVGLMRAILTSFGGTGHAGSDHADARARRLQRGGVQEVVGEHQEGAEEGRPLRRPGEKERALRTARRTRLARRPVSRRLHQRAPAQGPAHRARPDPQKPRRIHRPRRAARARSSPPPTSQARKNQRLNPAQALEFLVTRDEIVEKVPGLARSADAPTRRAVSPRRKAPPRHAHRRPARGETEARPRRTSRRVRRRMARHRARSRHRAAAPASSPKPPACSRKRASSTRCSTASTAPSASIRSPPKSLIWLCKERDGVFADLDESAPPQRRSSARSSAISSTRPSATAASTISSSTTRNCSPISSPPRPTRSCATSCRSSCARRSSRS